MIEFYKTREFESFYARSLKSSTDLEDLLQVSLNYSEEKTAIIGSWVCTHLVGKHNELFQKAHPQIINFLKNGQHQSSLRSWMKVLTYLEIDEKYHGTVIDLCVNSISNSNNKVALQVYSMFVLIPLMHLYPELFPEINALIDLHSINKSPAYHSASRHFKKNTKKLSSI